jgi:hypothetical protein
LASKHSAGVGTKKLALGGYEHINALVEAPESHELFSPLAGSDGVIEKVEKAPQGGNYIYLNKQQYYISPKYNPIVKEGQRVEAGDDLSDGIGHPNDLVRYRGLGQARRDYYKVFKEVIGNSGMNAHPRNIEAITTGLINHVMVNDAEGLGDFNPDDVVNYNRAFSKYSPRQGSEYKAPKQAYGMYLEEPVLHHTVGTRVNSKVIKDLEEFGIKDVAVHKDQPKFEPFFQRSLLALDADEDWITRLGGFYTGRGFQDSVQRGAVSDTNSTSWIPAVSKLTELSNKKKQTLGRF